MTIDEALIQLRIGPGINEDVSEEYNEAVNMAIEALEEQPNEDCISRKAIIDALHRYFADGFDSDKWWNSTYVLGAINEVPSATPQPKTGHWEWVQYESKPNFGNWHCSECRCILRGEIKENPIRLPKYCPECGAKMEEVQQ